MITNDDILNTEKIDTIHNFKRCVKLAADIIEFIQNNEEKNSIIILAAVRGVFMNVLLRSGFNIDDIKQFLISGDEIIKINKEFKNEKTIKE